MPSHMVKSGKTVTVDEKDISRSGSTVGSGNEERSFTVTGSDEEVDILEAFGVIVPEVTPRGLVYNGARYESETESLGDKSIWTVTAEFVRTLIGFGSGSLEVPVGTARLRLTSGTEDINTVLPIEILSRNAAAGKGEIGYEGIGDDGETFNGVNVPTGTFGFAYDFTIPKLTNDPAYARLMIDAVAKKNSERFKGFRAGEVLCTGINGVFSTNEDTTMTFIFKRREWVETQFQPAALPAAAERIQVPAHSPWDVLDVHTKTIIHTAPTRVHVTIRQIDILKVTPDLDFNDLQIPGSDIYEEA